MSHTHSWQRLERKPDDSERAHPYKRTLREWGARIRMLIGEVASKDEILRRRREERRALRAFARRYANHRETCPLACDVSDLEYLHRDELPLANPCSQHLSGHRCTCGFIEDARALRIDRTIDSLKYSYPPVAFTNPPPGLEPTP